MSIRPTRQGTVLAALVAALSLAGAAGAATASAVERPATFIGIEDGYGPTLADAQANASAEMNGDYVGCKRPYFLVSDGQLADGTWWARVEANGCTGYR